jgi:hypothetical protein
MTTERQFVACKYREGDKRTYTFVNDGPPVAPGDKVRVPDRSGDGWQRVIVAEIVTTPPAFECKPVLGKIDPEDPHTRGPISPPKPEQGDLL